MISKPAIYILCIETANSVTSLTLSKDGSCVALKETLEPNKAADKLHTLAEELMKNANLTFSNLNAVAISSGPGSYTGLRIATSAAKGYCFALDIPLISISTLEAMVYGVQTRYHQNGFDEYVPMVDARRMEVFTSFYLKNGEVTQSISSLIIDAAFKDLFCSDKKYMLFGNGLEKSKPFLLEDNSWFFDNFIPSAQDLCLIAHNRFMVKNFEELAYFEPNYAKPFHSTKIKDNY